jgi:membrane-bound serine protease (ClpP class)
MFTRKYLVIIIFLLMLAQVWTVAPVLAQSRPTAMPQASLVQTSQPLVLLLSADGPITPAMVEYLKRGLESAARQNAELLIFQLNTPGGSVELMNRMIQSIRASNVPVVVFVAPRGAMAGSAGALITISAHASAMAPETTIGASSPVGAQGEELGETIQAKEKNILKASVRSLTENRPPEAVALAEAMIETAEAVSAAEALKSGLIDFIALDVQNLLVQLDGFQVETISGTRTLNTTNAEVQTLENSLIERLLAVLTNPNIVFLLITIGVQAILIEMSSPGGWVAGTIGVICLALAFFGLGVLDVNWFGAIFLLLAFILFILDIKAPNHGALTAAGVLSLIVGALVLFNSPNLPAFQPRVSIPLVIIMSILTGGVFFAVLLFALRAQKVPIRVGMESMTTRTGRALTPISANRSGQVQVASEQWTAELAPGEVEIARDDPIEVVQVSGLRLVVRKISNQGADEEFR